MTKEEAIHEIEKVFELAFANYIITALTEGATSSDEEQQPKTGHWICHRDHCENLGVIPSGLGVYEWCSNCDCGIDIREWQRNHYNYCPNCGADMRGESK